MLLQQGGDQLCLCGLWQLSSRYEDVLEIWCHHDASSMDGDYSTKSGGRMACAALCSARREAPEALWPTTRHAPAGQRHSIPASGVGPLGVPSGRGPVASCKIGVGVEYCL